MLPQDLHRLEERRRHAASGDGDPHRPEGQAGLELHLLDEPLAQLLLDRRRRPVAVDDALDAIRGSGISLLATAADGEVALDAAGDILSGRVAWLFGNEAHGLSAEVQRSADHRVSIPIRGRAESLNVAAAAAICLYESARVHGAAGRV